MEASTVYHFGDFRLDSAARELWRGDEEVPLHRKAFDCLVYLIEHRDRAIARDELVKAVWGDVHLSDGALGQAIFEARRALDDTGQEQRTIRTMWRFGYRWVAPVSAAVPSATSSVALVMERAWPSRRALRLGAIMVLLAVGTLSGGTAYLSRHTDRGVSEWQIASSGGAGIALLLPVSVEPEDRHTWIRFGVMELIAERLRAAGQPMVPSATVIALTQAVATEPPAQRLERLTSSTGARLVLAAHAAEAGMRWRVSVRSLDGMRPEITAVADADDVLEAARLAADRTAAALGLTPASEPDTEPREARLLHQIDAAMLAQRMDMAKNLIETAHDDLRRRPEVRLRLARIEYSLYDLAAAQRALEALLDEPSVQRDPVLHARVLYALGGVFFQRGELDASRSVLDEALRLLRAAGPPAVLGQIWRSLGVVALAQGRFEAARMHTAQARRVFKSTGDAYGLARLDNHLGVLEALRERYAEALHHFAAAAEGLAALNDYGEELRSRTNMVEALLGLLDPRAALRLEPRLVELISRTTDTEIAAQGKLARAALLTANGRGREAEVVLADVLRAAEAGDLPLIQKTWALVLHAERLARGGDLDRAAGVVAEIVDGTSVPEDVSTDDYLGRAWRILLHARLTAGDTEAAARISAEMNRWAKRRPTQAPKIYASLAAAEVAAARGRAAAAEAAFERALALAERGHVPLRRLQVAQCYVPWLLDDAPPAAARAARALLVADRVAAYAEHDYEAALLQLRLYRALGPPSAWRAALARARALAGERGIPPQLLEASPTVTTTTSS